MNTIGNRMAHIEEHTPSIERQFVGWKDNPWTPEQMAAAIRRYLPPQKSVHRWITASPEEGPIPCSFLSGHATGGAAYTFSAFSGATLYLDGSELSGCVKWARVK